MFEFVLTGFTLVLALVITRILAGLRWIVAPGRFYWIHAVHVVSLLVLTSLIWWVLWYQRNNTWDYLSFAYNLLIGPGIMYFLAVLLVPDQPRRISQWKSYYFSIRKLLYASLVLLVVAAFIGAIAFNHLPLLHPVQLLFMIAAGLAITGWSTTSERVHAALALIVAAVIVVAVVFAARATPPLQ
jgi:hypothetical protein